MLGNHLKNKKMQEKFIPGHLPQRQRVALSVPFVLMAILFNVCLIASNLFETKIFTAGMLTLTGGVIIFPVSYILNDCIVEVWGFRKARLVFWDGGEHFDYIFGLAPRVTMASLLAFLSGSTVNAYIMSKMKVASHGKRFSVRAVVSSICGETVDSLVFFPIAFWGLAPGDMAKMMLLQIVLKTAYEVVILPVTGMVVRAVKKYEGADTFDTDISYNPFKITDI